MSYRQALAMGWAIIWRVFWWSLIVILPAVLIRGIVVFRSGSIGSARAFAMGAVLIPVLIALEVFLVLPLSIQEAVLDVYSESLQVSLLAFAIHGGLDWLNYGLRLPDRLGSARFNLVQLPVLVLLVYPAIAAVAVRVPFHGFRISVLPKAPLADTPAARI
jgi:hypothetical protein